MGGNAAAYDSVMNSIQALGRGFDVNYDTRLLYCKGGTGSRLVEVDDEHTKDLFVDEELVIPNVSRDVRCYLESSRRESTGVYSFSEMAEYFNKKAHLTGNIPLGTFNSVFSLTGSKQIDSAAAKTLAMEGVQIPLLRVQLMQPPLVLKESVKSSIPTSWDAFSLSSFIETFGTHIVTSVTVGGKDVIYVKQHQSSPLSMMEVKKYVQHIGDHRFSSTDSQMSSGPMRLINKGGDQYMFNSQGVYPHPSSTPHLTGKEDVTVIFRRRGGDDLIQSHFQWAKTIQSAPDVIDMTFCPIISLLDGFRGKDHLAHAIGLYLEYKPPIEELRCFLEFQVPRIWAPVQDSHYQRKEPVCPSLQFSIMGQKLYVSQEPVSVRRKPVTGLRLCLDGVKQNRLSIQLQHLVSLPIILQPYWDTHVAIGAPKWQGPEEQDSRWFEPVKWKNFSHVSSAPIECNDTFVRDLSGVSVVTGAQLGVWDFGARNVLYMKLLYSRLPGCTIRRSFWDHCQGSVSEKSRKSVGSSTNSNELSPGPKDIGSKLAKSVDMTEMTKGPQDSPGHWLVTGGKLGVEKGKIVLRVKYSLLNY